MGKGSLCFAYGFIGFLAHHSDVGNGLVMFVIVVGCCRFNY
jgi:hypothetical protein